MTSPRGRARTPDAWVRRATARLLSPAVFVGLWWLAATAKLVDPQFLPAPDAV
ncbi:hypothetical protein [Nocardia wallacei]|uniref:hypothetical protein n=1 Tax=Nocardia wallacei TaxID=480035 RepID=UPI002457301E|nr:hypothetical protein [Nocardia wallacei]